MATFDLTITYPDAQKTRIIDALKKHLTADGPDGPVVPTNAQVVEHLRQLVVAEIRSVVRQVEGRAAVIAAQSTLSDPDVS